MSAKLEDIASPAGAAVRIRLRRAADLVAGRQAARELGGEIGMSASELTTVASAIAELARNALVYAGSGELNLEIVEDDSRIGLAICVCDKGPGIADTERVLRGGYSTSGGLGLGLSGVRRMADSFRLDTWPGGGTRVSIVKWRD